MIKSVFEYRFNSNKHTHVFLFVTQAVWVFIVWIWVLLVCNPFIFITDSVHVTTERRHLGR